MFSPFCLLQRADSGGEGGDETGGVDLEGYVDAGCVGVESVRAGSPMVRASGAVGNRRFRARLSLVGRYRSPATGPRNGGGQRIMQWHAL